MSTVEPPEVGIQRTSSRVLGALVWAPSLIYLWFIVFRSVNLPFMDDWVIAQRLLPAYRRGYPVWADLWFQHTDVRIVGSKLIMYYVGIATGWHSKAMYLVQWLLYLWLLGCLVLIARRTIESSLVRNGLLLVVSFLMFSPVQVETWGFGMMFGLHLAWACVMTIVVLLRPGKGTWTRFAISALLCVFATFSWGSGVIAWAPLSVLIVAVMGRRVDAEGRERWAWGRAGLALGIWGLVWAASWAYFFHDYRGAGLNTMPKMSDSLKMPFLTVKSFFAVLGGWVRLDGIQRDLFNQFMMWTSVWAGLCLFIPAAAALVWWFWAYGKRREPVGEGVAWVTLALYALTQATTMAAGRIGAGEHAVMATRYPVSSLAMAIWLICMIVYVAWKVRLPLQMKQLAAAFALGGLIPLYAVTAARAMGTIEDVWYERRMLKSTVQFLQVTPLSPVIKDKLLHLESGTWLGKYAPTLEDEGFVRVGMVKSPVINQFIVETKKGRNGAVEGAGMDAKGTVHVGGWTYLKDAGREADAVLLTTERAPGEHWVFAVADRMGLARPDREKKFGRKYSRSGWTAEVTADRLPPDLNGLAAWAWDFKARKAYRLAGLPPEKKP